MKQFFGLLLTSCLKTVQNSYHCIFRFRQWFERYIVSSPSGSCQSPVAKWFLMHSDAKTKQFSTCILVLFVLLRRFYDKLQLNFYSVSLYNCRLCEWELGDGSLVRRVAGPKVTGRNYFCDVDVFCFVGVEFKLGGRVRRSERAVLIKHQLLRRKDRLTDTIRRTQAA